ncbi:hypothetical protein CIB95_11660 [Lottiidibacillus patelloidae]|uniref:Uncharacterized protein n=1 Tax=Lottiidibacillus patelloidae TaxID=2670334 RepID=A0A263BRU7_9BACI|nr:hypothetical protein CIB95_11660 [Lottiidibacillus patelloidae]
MIDPTSNLKYIPIEKNAPTSHSWWRFTDGEEFDTITLVIRNEHLGTIDTSCRKLKKVLQEIIDLANE